MIGPRELYLWGHSEGQGAINYRRIIRGVLSSTEQRQRVGQDDFLFFVEGCHVRAWERGDRGRGAKGSWARGSHEASELTDRRN